MDQRRINAADAPAPPSRYSQALEVKGAQRLLFVSGQIPVAKDGSVQKNFTAQARQAWANVDAQLRAAGMTLDNVVKVTIFLADRRHAMENRAARWQDRRWRCDTGGLVRPTPRQTAPQGRRGPIGRAASSVVPRPAF